jgi:hypothetical protein
MERSSELPIGDHEVRAIKGSIGKYGFFRIVLAVRLDPTTNRAALLPTPGRNSVIAVVWPKVRITLSLAPQLD